MMTTTHEDTARLLHRAARVLAASDSDYAAVRNDVGYSRFDGSFGHTLAATSPEEWTPRQVRGAWRMLRKYRGQLAAAGIDFDAIDEPSDPDPTRGTVTRRGDVFVIEAVQDAIYDRLAEAGCAPARIADAARTPGAVVEAEKQRFQTQDSCRAIVVSLEAGSVGHTLTASSNVVFAEMGWTPGLHLQAEDRCHRIGQTDTVTAWYLTASGTIEDDMAALLVEKAAVVSAVADGTVDTADPRAKINLMSELVGRLDQLALTA